MAYLTYAYVAVLVVVASALKPTPFRECEDGPKPLGLRIEDCTQLPCTLKRGANLTAEWDFGISASTEKLKPRVRVVLGENNPLNVPFPQKNACDFLTNAECPLDEGEEVTYRLTMLIAKYYPLIALEIEFALLDDNEKVQTCFKLDALVRD